MKKLYHGSISLFEKIDITKGRGYKDFGKGFYATAVSDHAEKIAIRNKKIAIKRKIALKYKNPNIKLESFVAYRYNLLFNEENLDHLNVKLFNQADVEWLKFIIKNRNSPVSVHDYDIVIGPTADAETTMIIGNYLDELIETSFSDEMCLKVISELKPENLPKQYFFGTEASLKTLSFDHIKRQEISYD